MNKNPSAKISLDGWLTLSVLLLASVLAVAWSARPARTNRGWGPLESTAIANPMVSSVGGITMLTSDGGTDEILVVLDNRTEMLMAYRVDNTGAVELMQRTPVGAMFTDARIKASGK